MEIQQKPVVQVQPTIQFRIKVPQLQCSTSRRSYLQTNCPSGYELLQAIQQKPLMANLSLFDNIFPRKISQTHMCQKKSIYFYTCLTCHPQQSIKICSECFPKAQHSNHNYFTFMSNEAECECGFSINNKFCLQHHKKFDYFALQKPEEQLYSYVAFVAEYLEIVLSKDKDQRKQKYRNVIQYIFFRITGLNEQSLPYNIATTHTLALTISGTTSQTLLQRLIVIINNERFLFPSIDHLCRRLCNYEPFQMFLVKAFFQVTPSKAVLDPSLRLQETVSKLYKSLYIIGSLAEKGILIYQKQFWNAFHIYKNALGRLSNYEKNIKVNRFLSHICWILIKKQKYVQPLANMFTEELCIRVADNFELVSEVVKYLLKKKSYQDLSKRKTDHAWFNSIIKICLYVTKGSIQKIPQIFKNFLPEKLSMFLRNYFKEILRKKGKCKFNILTLTSIFKIAQTHGLLGELSNIHEVDQISCLKFTENVLILLRNLIGSEHYIAFHQWQVASYYKNYALVSSCKQKIMEWFRDFLYMKKQVSHQLVKSLKQLGIICLQETREILQKQTQYISSKAVFRYKGPDRTINPDQLLINIKDFSQFQHLIYKEPDCIYFTPERMKIILCLLSQNIKKVQIQYFSSYLLQERNKIAVAAVLMDKLVKGEVKSIKQYVENIRNSVMKLKVITHQLGSLFSLQPVNKSKQNQQKSLEQQIMVQKTLVNTNDCIGQENSPPKSTTSIEQQVPETPPKVQVKLEKVMTESERKRAQKIRKLKQKFARKSHKFINHPYFKSLQHIQEQKCLICRQPTSQEDSCLYYLGSIKEDEIPQLIFNIEANHKSISSCFHPYHQRCLAKSNNNHTCILCKFVGNFLLPVMSDRPCSQFILKVWWDDFVEISSFTPKQSNSGSSHYDGFYYDGYRNYNNYQPVKAPESPQSTQPAAKQQQRVKNFMMLYKSIMLKLGPMSSRKSWEENMKNNKYFCELIRYYYSSLTNHQKIELKQEIQNYQESIRKSSKLTQFVRDLLIFGSQAFIAKLDSSTSSINNEKAREKIQHKCIQVIKKYPNQLIQNFVLNVQWLLNTEIRDFDQGQLGKTIGNKQYMGHLYSFELPKTMKDIYEMRVQCKKCHSLNSWYCIFCKIIECQHCFYTTNHAKITHSGKTILVLYLNTGSIVAINSNKSPKALYYDVFQTAFDPATSTNPSEYKCSQEKAQQVLSDIFKFL